MGLGSLVVGVVGKVSIFAKDEFGNKLTTITEADRFFLVVMECENSDGVASCSESRTSPYERPVEEPEPGGVTKVEIVINTGPGALQPYKKP
jgi:hypothetical protein